MTSDHEEVRLLLAVLATKVGQCQELLEAQNVGNALYGMCYNDNGSCNKPFLTSSSVK